MRKLNALVFDEIIPANASPSAMYTSSALNEQLGMFDKLSIMAVADNVSGGTPTVTVRIQHSADQRNWNNKNGTAEINAVTIPAGEPPSAGIVGTDSGSTGALGFVRLSILLSANTTAHVKVYVTARDPSQ